MPGPFPGMDPYLERPVAWKGVHASLIYCLASQLNLVLPPGFSAEIEERLYLLEPSRTIWADLALVTSPGAAPLPSRGSAALAEVDAPHVARLMDQEETTEQYITIVDIAHGDHLVGVIEVLSPANKEPGAGRESYLRNQRQVRDGRAHLLEIDLLRAGEHTLAIPREIVQGHFDYLVCLSDSRRRQTFFYWPLLLRDRLPRLRMPLTGEDESVLIDLQAALGRVWETGSFPRRQQEMYRGAPEPPLGDADAGWAEALLREKGLR